MSVEGKLTCGCLPGVTMASTGQVSSGHDLAPCTSESPRHPHFHLTLTRILRNKQNGTDDPIWQIRQLRRSSEKTGHVLLAQPLLVWS